MPVKKQRIQKDINDNQLLNLVLEQSTSEGSRSEAEIWYNTSGDVIKYQDGAGVKTVATSADVAALTLEDVRSVDNQLSGNIDANSNTITNLASPSDSGDAASKGYVDAVFLNEDTKDPVIVASSTNVDISSELQDGDTVDGYVVSTGDRVLLYGQTNPEENGIYVVVASGAASRSVDANSNAKVTYGMKTWILGGTHSGQRAILTTNSAITLDTTELTFAVSSFGNYTAGDGIDITGGAIVADVSDFAGSGLEDDGSNNLRISAAAAGAGLTGGAGSALAVNVDNSSIEISTDTVQVKALGITNAMLAGSIADSKLNQITTANKVAGSAVQLASNGGIENSSGLKIAPDSTTGATVVPISLGANGAGVTVDNATLTNNSGTAQIKDGGVGFTQIATAAKPHVDTFVSGDFSSGVYTLAQTTHGLTAGKFTILVEEDDGTNYIAVTGDVMAYEVKSSGDVKIEVTVGQEFNGRIKLIPNA